MLFTLVKGQPPWRGCGKKFEVWILRELMDDICVMTAEILPLKSHYYLSLPQPRNVRLGRRLYNCGLPRIFFIIFFCLPSVIPSGTAHTQTSGAEITFDACPASQRSVSCHRVMHPL
jgi:hypothetical protein